MAAANNSNKKSYSKDKSHGKDRSYGKDKSYGEDKRVHETNINILKDDIKNRKLRNIYLFYGPEEYMKNYYLNALEKLIPDDGFMSLNRVVFEGKPEIAKIIDGCEALPIFSEKKLVLVKNSNFFKFKKKVKSNTGSEIPEDPDKTTGHESSGKEDTGKEDIGKEDTEKENSAKENTGLNLLLQNIPQHTCLIFYETEITESNKTVAIINNNGLVVKFPFQKPADLVAWVIKAFRADDKEVDFKTASKLVEFSENNMNELLNEANKVMLYVGDRKNITEEDIDIVCTQSVKSRIFDLTDAATAKDGTKALKILYDLFIMKEPYQLILFMIERHFRQLLEFRLISEEGLSLAETASRMGILPYIAGKLQKQSSRFSSGTLKMILEECFEIELSVKKGLIGFKTGIELLLVKITAA